MARLADWLWPGHPKTWREVPFRLYSVVTHVLRLSAAAVLAYLCSHHPPGQIDITGPLTALLVLQASAYTTLKAGFVRVGAVLTGIAVAIALSTWAGLHWWSLGLCVATALLLGKLFRLGNQAMEAPISAMLILATTQQALAIEVRVLNTLVGAAMGITFAILVPPTLPIRAAAHAIRRVAAHTSGSLRAAADTVARTPISRAEVNAWLRRVYAVSEQLNRADRLVREVGDARKFNPRAIGTADVEPVLRSGLDVLERTSLLVRTLFRVIEREAPSHEGGLDSYGTEVREAFSVVLYAVADSIDGFADLVAAEAVGEERGVAERFAESLDSLRETRAILTELLLVDPREQPSLWLLRGSILSAIEQILDQVDLERRARTHEQWRATQVGRRLTQGQLLNRDTVAQLRHGRLALRPRRVGTTMPPLLEAAEARWPQSKHTRYPQRHDEADERHTDGQTYSDRDDEG